MKDTIFELLTTQFPLVAAGMILVTGLAVILSKTLSIVGDSHKILQILNRRSEKIKFLREQLKLGMISEGTRLIYENELDSLHFENEAKFTLLEPYRSACIMMRLNPSSPYRNWRVFRIVSDLFELEGDLVRMKVYKASRLAWLWRGLSIVLIVLWILLMIAIITVFSLETKSQDIPKALVGYLGVLGALPFLSMVLDSFQREHSSLKISQWLKEGHLDSNSLLKSNGLEQNGSSIDQPLNELFTPDN